MMFWAASEGSKESSVPGVMSGWIVVLTVKSSLRDVTAIRPCAGGLSSPVRHAVGPAACQGDALVRLGRDSDRRRGGIRRAGKMRWSGRRACRNPDFRADGRATGPDDPGPGRCSGCPAGHAILGGASGTGPGGRAWLTANARARQPFGPTAKRASGSRFCPWRRRAPWRVHHGRFAMRSAGTFLHKSLDISRAQGGS